MAEMVAKAGVDVNAKSKTVTPRTLFTCIILTSHQSMTMAFRKKKQGDCKSFNG
ncbi:LETM1 domain-containing protein LETM2, mitochondrial [Platysternon megacephalum]|uniref:LETM1 domain-containing protein LETM2, mitochondrial n=1 Tax=Platysternon megacephalum TaxID=55544 RepID=A0A4D9ECB6_9SAUR|nr:LETM1 domain-containing protein LETM2, mitochondrial [Platysternon megacephalum]